MMILSPLVFSGEDDDDITLTQAKEMRAEAMGKTVDMSRQKSGKKTGLQQSERTE